MNFWPSGKYVHLLHMYSRVSRGSFCFNYWLNSAWHGGDQFVVLLRWCGSPGFFDSGLLLICIFWSLVSHFPLDNTPYILNGVQVWFSRLVVHLFLPHFFLPLNFLLTCLDTALCEQPASLAMNVCGLPSLWRVSMIVFWTTARLEVFPMIV